MTDSSTTPPADLTPLRERIDSIDEQVLALINERAGLAKQIGQLKSSTRSEYYIPSRERAILERLNGMNDGPLQTEAINSVFREIISACRSLEATLAISYLGPEGSYHHAAAQSHFGRSANYLPATTIGQVIDDVERDRVDYGIVAIENSIEGSVTQTLDRLVNSSATIVGERYLRINHNLISYSELHEITKVYSHPQALAQCRGWLEANLPDVPQESSSSTTKAVQLCQEERTAAAIAGVLASDIFDVPIQVRGIEDMASNTTRFYIAGKKPFPRSGDDKTSLIVFVRDQVGALYTMLEPFKRIGINLSNIVSRPSRQEAWQYMFFLECNSHQADEKFRQAVEEIESNSLYVKILGSYPRALHTTDAASVE